VKLITVLVGSLSLIEASTAAAGKAAGAEGSAAGAPLHPGKGAAQGLQQGPSKGAGQGNQREEQGRSLDLVDNMAAEDRPAVEVGIPAVAVDSPEEAAEGRLGKGCIPLAWGCTAGKEVALRAGWGRAGGRGRRGKGWGRQRGQRRGAQGWLRGRCLRY